MDQVILDLGCGDDKKGNVGLDVYRTKDVDVIGDVNISIPFKDSSVDRVIANHVLEHVDDVIDVMEEIYRVLKKNGIVEITVPHATSLNAFADPTHKHFFTAFTMNYFTDKSELSYYSKARFVIQKREFEFKPRWNWLRHIFNLRPEFFEKFLKITPFQVNMHWVMVKKG